MGSEGEGLSVSRGEAVAIGQRVGPWLLEALVGRGGAGQVFRARHVVSGEVAAVKLPHGFLVDSASARERFRREAAALARVSDSHVVQVREAGEDGGRAYLAMEWLEGETLAARLAGGRLALPEAVQIARDVASGLDALHAQGVVHRDVKAANVMLVGTSAKILDLGIAYFLDGGIERVTLSGVAPGSLTAMAPEQLTGAPVTAAADVWALGVLVFHMLAGRPPFDAADTTDLARRVAQGATPSLRGQAGVPLAVDGVLARCFAHDPGQRFASAGAVAEALSAAVITGSSVRRVEPGEALALAIHAGGSFTAELAREGSARCAAHGYTVVVARPGQLLAVKLVGGEADRQDAQVLVGELAALDATLAARMHEGRVKTLTIDGRRQVVGGDLLSFMSWPDIG